MMIAIIEDDDDKRAALIHFVETNYVVDFVFVAKSLQGGLKLVLTKTLDLVLLDMSMKNFDKTLEDDGGRPHSFAGREILRQMKREGRPFPVIVVTHFDEFGGDSEKMTLDELKFELSQKYPNYLGTVHFRHDVDKWENDIAAVISSRLPKRN